ncbi:tetratricopeptide repeat protein [uncultured Erythrobacter sp.]|uniref:tetratricopeptide repeat protein n=1 Tax=uncultured Erythrobacter sp. TaxID=263913 RepID=UPI0026377BD5|nr:tetratricopeptide repeat protein [uncultured Erythrobacter sp.]
MGALSKIAKAALAGCAAIVAMQPLGAETIPVSGVYAPDVALPADIELIVIERFRGDVGSDVELALTEALGNVIIRGEPWFELARPRDLRDAVVEVEGNDGTIHTVPLVADAELRGTVRSEVIERRVDDKVERECVARDEDGDCIERREVRIECREISVRIDPRILLIAQNGEQLYSQNRSRTEAERFCLDSYSVPSSLDMGNALIARLVADIRGDLAPVQSRRNIRVMESRSDLNRADRRPFRDAVRATNESIEAACSGFEALEATNPAHVSVLFNIGLCYESGGELERAADYYSRALEVDPDKDYPRDGMRRIRSREQAEIMLAEREAL